MTTFTIELDDTVFARLRKLAAAQNVSVSQMAQRLLDVRVALPVEEDALGPLTRAASGIAPPMTDQDVQHVLEEERMRTYGGR